MVKSAINFSPLTSPLAARHVDLPLCQSEGVASFIDAQGERGRLMVTVCIPIYQGDDLSPQFLFWSKVVG